MNSLYNKVLRLSKVLKGKDFFFPVQTKLNTATLGNKGAAWTVYAAVIQKNSIIYSIGAGTDISFDLEMIRLFDVKIHVFDPTPKSVNWVRNEMKKEGFPVSQFNFSAYGLSDYNGKATFVLPENPEHVSAKFASDNLLKDREIEVEVRTLQRLMEMNGHTQIDVLKMDIEGAEYEVITDILKSGTPIKQWCIEFHHRFEEVGIAKTKEALDQLNAAGYKVFSISNNGEEFSLIKE